MHENVNSSAARCLARGLGFHPPYRLVNEFAIARDLKLLFDIHAMHRDRLITEVKVVGDLLGGFAMTNEFIDLELAIAELAEW